MPHRPRLLDLFCGEGGAGAGYAAAGFDVTGVDLAAKVGRRYPFTFVAGDALEYLAAHGHEYDAVHASPPCQAYTAATRAADRTRYPRLIDPVRRLLVDLDVPYVIENVPGAPLRAAVLLCGSMFDLAADDVDGTRLVLRRHRLFETNTWGWQLHCRHDPADVIGGVYSAGPSTRSAAQIRHGGYTPPHQVRAALMGIDWMTQKGLCEAIPPAYTEHLGRQLLEHLARTDRPVSAL